MRNIHVREISAHSVEQVRPWLEAGWSATARDPFPRDVIRNWRKNPPGEDPQALIPNVTRLGHGPFAFRFESWDGAHWRVRVDTRGYRGWHGFDLEPTASGCRLKHTLELDLTGPARLIWPTCFNALHDWAVEAMFDRIEEALRTGEMPAVTRRPMPMPAAIRMSLVSRVLRRRGKREARHFA